MPITKKEIEAVLTASWENGEKAVEDILAATGWSRHEYSNDAQVIATPKGAKSPLRILAVEGGKLNGVLIPDKPKGSLENRMEQDQTLVKLVSDATNETASESDVADEWTWTTTDRTVKLVSQDEGISLRIYRKGSDPFPN